jgi:hypothetical protein
VFVSFSNAFVSFVSKFFVSPLLSIDESIETPTFFSRRTGTGMINK